MHTASDQNNADSHDEFSFNFSYVGKGVLGRPTDIVLVQDGKVIDKTESVVDQIPNMMYHRHKI